MREIKFRAWDEGNKVMHHNMQFIKSGDNGNDWITFSSDEQGYKESKHAIVLDNPYFRQQVHLMQYTGLNDKNGKEIYEGDIITFIFRNSIHDAGTLAIWEVYWHDGGFSYGKKSEGYAMFVYKEWASRVEIIGNIHESASLLNSEQNAQVSDTTEADSKTNDDKQNEKPI